MKIIQNPEYTHKVNVNVPVDGGSKEETFKARFRVLPWSRFQEIGENVSDDQIRAILKEVLIDAEDLQDESGNALAFNDEVRDWLIDMPFTRTALFQTYMDTASGQKVKN